MKGNQRTPGAAGIQATLSASKNLVPVWNSAKSAQELYQSVASSCWTREKQHAFKHERARKICSASARQGKPCTPHPVHGSLSPLSVNPPPPRLVFPHVRQSVVVSSADQGLPGGTHEALFPGQRHSCTAPFPGERDAGIGNSGGGGGGQGHARANRTTLNHWQGQKALSPVRPDHGQG